MSETKYTKTCDVVAIGAVCVDARVIGDDALLERHGLIKAASNDVGAAALKRITDEPDLPKTAGGPATNVAVGIALRGGSSALVGKVANDELGVFFTQRVQSLDVSFTPLAAEEDGPGTTFVMVITTPDKERSFACYNGAGLTMTPEDLDPGLINEAKITYLDSYLWLSETGRETVQHAAVLAKAGESRIALSLNDAGLIARNREAYLELATNHADILVGDMKEFNTLLGTATLEEAAKKLETLGVTAAITAGAKGAWVVENGALTHVPAQKIAKLVDTSGAGDQFAAGFLYGLAQDKSAVEAANIGASWAADIIQHFGAEPQVGKNAPPKASKPPSENHNPVP
jgi:sugar/nucleoside kinase (ribokinase family)